MTDGQNEPDLAESRPVEPDWRAELELDWEALAVAFENQLPESHSFLDLGNGKVVTLTGTIATPEPPDPVDQYVHIQPRPSREGYRTMQNFIQTVEDPLLKEKLGSALVGKGAFRRFKDQLLSYPDVRQQWFAFKDAEVYAYVGSWLESAGIKATNEPPATTSREKLPVRSAGAEAERRDVLTNIQLAQDEQDFKAAIAPWDRPGLTFRTDRTALLVVDMQKVFVDPEGDSFLPMAVPAGEKLARVIQACRRADVPVIFTRHVHQYPQQDGGSMSRWWRSLIEEGTEGAELAGIVEPQEQEPVITKCRYSAFAGTRLEMILRSMRIEDLLIGGVMTNLCCETTARDAFVRDFNVYFLGDGTATADTGLHLASLKNIAYGFGRVMGVSEAIELLDLAASRLGS